MHLLTQWVLGLPPALMCLVPGLVVFAEPALVLGVVLPSVGSMLLLGFLAHAGAVPLPVAVATGVLGAGLGDTTAFLVGRRWATRRDRLRRVVGERRWDRAERFVLCYGGLAVVGARYLTGLRTLVPRIGGLSGMSYRRFLAHSAPAAASWGATFVLAGYLAGASYRQVADAVGTGGGIALGALAAAAVVALLAVRVRRRTRPARDGAAEPGTDGA
ncbi:MAG TPA: DedA family protein [Actinocatenispora sp.]